MAIDRQRRAVSPENSARVRSASSSQERAGLEGFFCLADGGLVTALAGAS
jgi:hypothetical protein